MYLYLLAKPIESCEPDSKVPLRIHCRSIRSLQARVRYDPTASPAVGEAEERR
jgi:hypothetical protein